MLSQKELIQRPEYWIETLQNEIFRQVYTYMNNEKLNQTQLAEKLGFSRGYISQILNGNFNFSIKKLIELSISIGVVPKIQFQSIYEYIEEKEQNKVFYLEYTETMRETTEQEIVVIPNKSEFKTLLTA
ncbi:MAG: helix-turn-helix domain-containing protein [Bacteroidales bacterium]|nr:helix-turn-helix domain-containing protein [Bacteroidales bacterium]